MSPGWAVDAQHQSHFYDLKARGCTCDGYEHVCWPYKGVARHHEPFSQCPPCLRNLAQYGLRGAALVRVMREYAEEGVR